MLGARPTVPFASALPWEPTYAAPETETGDLEKFGGSCWREKEEEKRENEKKDSPLPKIFPG